MIFVTVGTHEQQFNRLIQKMDELIDSDIIKEEVFIQRGIKSVIPVNCPSIEMLGYQQMIEKVKNARIVITHGGPGSIMMPLSFKKLPIVVPRQAKFGEHVDNHQINFTKRLELQKKIIAIYEIEMLKKNIEDYEIICRTKDISAISNNSVDLLIKNLDHYCISL